MQAADIWPDQGTGKDIPIIHGAPGHLAGGSMNIYHRYYSGGGIGRR